MRNASFFVLFFAFILSVFLKNVVRLHGDAGSTLSVYAGENVMEFIAEAYSEYRNNPQPRRYARAVYLRLKVLWEQRGGGAQ